MTPNWSLPALLDDLNSKVERDLAAARRVLAHPVDKGDASQEIWIRLLSEYLPKRYEVRSAHVIDSHGASSEQQDVVVHDRQYSPFVLRFENTDIIPAESVYAVFEAKQELTADTTQYAQGKIASVRSLHRTSLPVPTVSGEQEGKELHHIIGGVLTLDCAWNPPFGRTMKQNLEADLGAGRLDLGCVAHSGTFEYHEEDGYTLSVRAKPVTAFLLELIARLQAMGTVPMIDVRAYARHL